MEDPNVKDLERLLSTLSSNANVEDAAPRVQAEASFNGLCANQPEVALSSLTILATSSQSVDVSCDFFCSCLNK